MIARIARLGPVLLAGCALAWLLCAPLLAQDAVGVEKLTGTLKKVQDSRKITIGYRDASVPFSFLAGRRQPIGYSIDLCLAIVDEVRTDLNLPDLQVAYFPVNPQTRIALVANGTVDLECGSTTNNTERQKSVAFSPVMFVSGTKLMAKRTARFKDYHDVKGRTVVVTEGTTNEATIKALNAKENLGYKIVSVRDHDLAFQTLDSGQADAWANDDVLLYAYQAQAKNPANFIILGDYLSYDPYGLMFRKDDPAFADLVKRTFEKMAENGELRQTYIRWFQRNLPSGKSLNLAMSAQLVSIFEALGLQPE